MKNHTPSAEVTTSVKLVNLGIHVINLGIYLELEFESDYCALGICLEDGLYLLHLRESSQATTGISLLMSMVTQKKILAQTGEIMDAKDVEVNTLLAVKAGEVIPIDGIVVVGRCDVDEKSPSSLTLKF
ncbi:putative cadmium/zinc-transporting ATPase HMA4 [Platanthera zijinensis]|uniref:Cadmium/zinc-transporting ATPase HMA4 n=1 Tax=Platanthera zijinensis TaxID=2320716 RepID=A0AAP0BKJ1_9ASPA